MTTMAHRGHAGNNKADRGYTVINVSKQMAESGVKYLSDLGS